MQRGGVAVGMALVALVTPPGIAAQEGGAAPFPWDARAAEHLLNRAAFGARPREIAAAVAMGREAFVDGLILGTGEPLDSFFARDWEAAGRRARREGEGMDRSQVREEVRRIRRLDGRQLGDFSAYWIERMLSGEDPLRERMTLFWHGHFTSSMDGVKSSYLMIRQHELLRANALGSFETLVRGIARDPAMLVYLDNASNRRQHPNENLARELMELFTLGEGNYTEADVKEAARAFTGWTRRGGEFVVRAKLHDGGVKTVLGRSGTFDGDDVIDILLEQEACAEHIAGKLITWFEGIEPDAARLAEYAAHLREEGWDVASFLRRLFLDPDFYRDEVVGTRISGPVEHLVATSRRLGTNPPPILLVVGARILGQGLFFPPSVKGWDEGRAWFDTSRLMQRGNLAGVLVGTVEIDELSRVEEDVAAADVPGATSMDGSMAGEVEPAASPSPRRRRLVGGGALRRIRSFDWRPRLNLTRRVARGGARKDGQIVAFLADELLAVELPKDTRRYLIELLRRGRKELGLENGRLLARPDRCEPLLRRLAHLMLSLPEAQLL